MKGDDVLNATKGIVDLASRDDDVKIGDRIKKRPPVGSRALLNTMNAARKLCWVMLSAKAVTAMVTDYD